MKKNNMIGTIIVMILSAFMGTSMAQKKAFTLDDVMAGGKNNARYRMESLHNQTWWGDRLVVSKGDTCCFFEANGKQSSLWTLNDINQILSSGNKKALKSMPAFTFPEPKKEIVQFTVGNEFYRIDWKNRKILENITLKAESKNREFCAATCSFAYTEGNNVYVIDRQNKIAQASFETHPNVVCGTSVHRNEFGIHKGLFWSPNGRFLAFYRMDESMVGDYPLVDISAREAALRSIKYPMAGMTSHQVSVGIYDVENNKTIYLETGAPLDRYFTNLSWTPDENQLLIAELNRDQNKCDMIVYDIHTGKPVKTLFTEQSEKYVEPEKPAYFFTKKSDQFLWLSGRDGYKHLYWYDLEGNLLKQLTSGEWTVLEIIGTDEKEENLFILSTEHSPIDRTVSKINLKSGKRTTISTESGIHSALLSVSGNYLSDTYTSLDQPRRTDMVNTKTLKRHNLFQATDPFAEFEKPTVELGTLKSADGKYDLYYRMVKPVGFDPSKRYPTVVYVYGGPKSQMVNNAWMANYRGWELYMAQKGFLIFCMDGRGTDYRGLDFEQATHKYLGVHEAEDQLVGAKFLQSLPYVDKERIGVSGWSFGGFMTINLLLRYPDVFKVGVAGGPVCDWKYYEIMYGERYMSSPQKNPEGYKESSLLEHAGQLKGRLLIIHDDMDDTVVLQHSINFLKSCIKAGTYPDYFIYPGHPHNVYGPDQVHLHKKITRYFEDYLK